MRRVQRESEGNGRPSFSHLMVGFGYPDAMQGSSTLCPTCTSPDWKLSSTDGVDSVGSAATPVTNHFLFFYCSNCSSFFSRENGKLSPFFFFTFRLTALEQLTCLQKKCKMTAGNLQHIFLAMCCNFLTLLVVWQNTQ